MKYLIFITPIILMLTGCNQSDNHQRVLQNQIDSLQSKLDRSYKPGFGEFMSNIQTHHAKLWFAGENQNWKLADFEINEIKENLEGIQKYCSERKETKSIGMINLAMDSLNNSILKKSKIKFRKNYINLTYSCNACHQATNHEYNVIVVPKNSPFSNQDFQIKN